MTNMKPAMLLEKLCSRVSLSFEEHQQIFSFILNGALEPAQTSAFLAGLRMLGESADVLVAGAQAMRALAVPVQIPEHLRPLIDNCGTGGDGSSSFNISTTAAIVAGSCGVHIAKHGNRSVSSKCGSADLLFAAGFPDNLGGPASVQLLEKTGFTFFFAPGFHPALKAIMPVRKALGIRTVFNLLGPLANPVKPEFQIIGVGHNLYLRPVAEALARLGIEKAMVVHSRDGLDELSPCAPSDCLIVEKGATTELVVDPANLGIAPSSLSDLKGGDPSDNLKILNSLLDGKGNRAVMDAVSLNAGAALWLRGKTETLRDGVELAHSQLTSKLTREYFKSWVETGKQLVAETP